MFSFKRGTKYVNYHGAIGRLIIQGLQVRVCGIVCVATQFPGLDRQHFERDKRSIIYHLCQNKKMKV
ncbi:hypothetical protein IC582_015423 [Cucumis melo]